jgi:hypothetical protein
MLPERTLKVGGGVSRSTRTVEFSSGLSESSPAEKE